MDIKRVIVRKPVSDANKKAGIKLICSMDVQKIQGMLRNFSESSDEEKMNYMHIIVALDTAAHLLGFCKFLDLLDFISIYGPDALL